MGNGLNLERLVSFDAGMARMMLDKLAVCDGEGAGADFGIDIDLGPDGGPGEEDDVDAGVAADGLTFCSMRRRKCSGLFRGSLTAFCAICAVVGGGGAIGAGVGVSDDGCGAFRWILLLLLLGVG